MTANSSTDELRQEPGEALDRLLSDFFKSHLPDPWPSAPDSLAAEPATLVAARVTSPQTPSQRCQLGRDGASQSRYTLAVSILMLLGVCWFFSSGTRPGLPGGRTEQPAMLLKGAGASKPAALEEIRKGRATQAPKANGRPPMPLP